MPLPQSGRTIQIQTPLGEDVFAVAKFTGREALSRLFQFQLELISETDTVSANSIVGKNVSVSIKRPDDELRFFNGFVSRWIFRGRHPARQAGGRGQPLSHYRAVLVPWTWFLTRTTDCRIFQHKSVPDIVEQIFGEYGFSDFDMSRLSGHYAPREYCVQYRESDFDFLGRLLEEEGIYYYFRHEHGRHVLVASDQVTGTFHCDEREVAFPETTTNRETPQILTWEHEYEFRSGQYSHTDYNFQSPGLNLLANEQTVVGVPEAVKFEQYDYPGEYQSVNEGRRYARLRMEAEEVPHDMVVAESNCRSFSAGGKFDLTGHYSDGESNQTRLITAIEHVATHREERSDEQEHESEVSYRNKFTSMPAEHVFRPERKTPRPFVRGTQTATVVGPAGEIVHPDEFGRVKVQFHWDREGKQDENSSCWVRVSQDWAGAGYGSLYLPHIGQEVIVDFLEGDPDQPIITGRVYNAEQKVPVTLPDQKYVSVVARDHYGNEIVFDGTPEDEHIIIHSPHHESWLQLGRSVVGYTDSDSDSWTVGNTASVTVGTTSTVNVGIDTTIRLGVDIGATLGLSFGFSWAGALTWGYGFNYSYFKGTQISNGGQNCYNSCDVDHVINAGKELSLSGGGGGPGEGLTGKNSIINLNESRLEVSFGKKNSPIRKDSGVQKLASSVAVLGALTAAGTAIAAGEVADDEDQGITSKRAAGGILTAESVAAMGLAAFLARQIWEKHDPVNHDDAKADAKITLLKNGVVVDAKPHGKHYMQIRNGGSIQMVSEKDIKQFAKSKVVLDAKNAVYVQAPQVMATKGIFQTRNIKDLG